MNSIKGSEANLIFEIQGGPDVEVVDFVAHERISTPYCLDVALASSSEIQFESVIEKESVLTVRGMDSERCFHGIVRKFEYKGKSGKTKHLYSAEVVPFTELLSLEQDCRIFQDKQVQEIVEDIFKDSKIPSDRYEFRLFNKEHKRRFCVQYRETDLDFISRIIQEEGIYYFYEHSKDKHVMVFADDPVCHKPIAGNTTLEFKPSSGLNPESEVISLIEFSRRLRPGTYVQTNYNFKMPSVPLQTLDTHKDETIQKYEIYDYPGQYGEEDRGSKLTRAFMAANTASRNQAKGVSNCPRLLPGHTFAINGHDSSEFNKEYLVFAVKHSGQQPQSLEEQAAGGANYDNHFLVIPSNVPYRPLKSIPKPYIHGIQSATVVGPENEEIYVDEFGRVKVQFHWDRLGKRDENSSCWLRCAQTWGGGGWGAVFIPRIGDEVLVSFMEGDPDWPIITGSVYNGRHTPLYDLPAGKTRTVIRTRSTPKGGYENYNELRFEDRAGNEEIYLQGEKDWNILIKNDKGQTIGHDETLSVANNRTKSVGVNQTISIGANHTETIGANKNETVTINKMETIGVAKELSIGGLYQVSVGAAMNETVAGAKAEEVGLTKAVLVGVNMTEKVMGNRSISVEKDMTSTVRLNSTLKAKTITLEAEEEIIFKAGNSTITMKSSGDIVIEGSTLTEKASGEIVIKGAKTSIN